MSNLALSTRWFTKVELLKLVSAAFLADSYFKTKMARQVNTALQLAGEIITRGGVTQTVFLFDSNGDVLISKGATVPTDASAGFAVGALFIDSTGGANVTLYVNEGTAATSCDFNAAVAN